MKTQTQYSKFVSINTVVDWSHSVKIHIENNVSWDLKRYREILKKASKLFKKTKSKSF